MESSQPAGIWQESFIGVNKSVRNDPTGGAARRVR